MTMLKPKDMAERLGVTVRTPQGNQKHHTKHNEYICYQCGAIMDRDENAVQNLLALA